MAKELNHSVDDPAWPLIVAEIPFDFNWSQDVDYERGYLKAGYKRYKLNIKKLDSEEHMVKHSTEDKGEISKEDKHSALGQLKDPINIEIKVESVELLKLKEEIRLLKSAERLYSGELAKYKKQHADILALEDGSPTGIDFNIVLFS